MRRDTAVSALDRHIGQRLRALRTRRGLSLDAVGEVIDVSQQQISRFELGRQRMSAVQLFRLARGLDVPISWFFRDYQDDTDELVRLRLALREERGHWQVESSEEKERALLVAWRALPSEQQRDAVLQMMEVFSRKQEQGRRAAPAAPKKKTEPGD